MKINEYGRISVNGHRVGPWRWRDENGPAFAKLRQTHFAVLRSIAALIERRDELRKDARFTDQGIRSELQKFIMSRVAPVLAKATKLTIATAQAEVKNRLAALDLQGPDKSDTASALLRQEIRAHLRSLPAKERQQLLFDPDPMIACAVVEAPAILSGVPETTRGRLIDKAVEALHPKEKAAIAELAEAIETARNAVKAAIGEIASGLSVASRQVEEMIETAKPVEWRGDVYLKKDESGRTTAIYQSSDGKAVGRPATDDDIAFGTWIDDNNKLPNDWLRPTR